MLKKTENPPVQWPQDLSLDAFQGRWWAVQVKSRQEKALAWDIYHSEGSYFLPMYEVIRTSRGRSWKSVLVLFPGYVFVCLKDEESRLKVLQTGRIAQMIEVIDQNRLVQELQAVKQVMDTRLAMDPYAELVEGVRCRVRSGPLAGVEGKVDRKKSPNRLLLEVSLLGQGVSVEIDAALLEVVEEVVS